MILVCALVQARPLALGSDLDQAEQYCIDTIDTYLLVVLDLILGMKMLKPAYLSICTIIKIILTYSVVKHVLITDIRLDDCKL